LNKRYSFSKVKGIDRNTILKELAKSYVSLLTSVNGSKIIYDIGKLESLYMELISDVTTAYVDGYVLKDVTSVLRY